jgi:hypothetical protein
MNEMGGYFELQLKNGMPYHTGLALNTGRNALEYILKSRKYKRLFLPYYICDAILEPLVKIDIPYVFYRIDKDLEPITISFNGENEALLYVNYFSLKSDYIYGLAQKYKNLIIDNSQAFFSPPIPSIDTFYSARKFFGVPDGAYLYSTSKFEESFEKDCSINRMSHLVKRLELGAEVGYKDFLLNEKKLSNQPIRLMSKTSNSILNNIDYEYAKKCREDNFRYLHQHLSRINKLNIDSKNICGPMVYPFLCEQEDLRKKLINKKIFVATYWKNVFEQSACTDWEYYLARFLIPLPIDHRYNTQNMNLILEQIL